MRGADCEQSSMFSYISAELRVPKDHPLRAVSNHPKAPTFASSRSKSGTGFTTLDLFPRYLRA
jgi:hypothetical protein